MELSSLNDIIDVFEHFFDSKYFITDLQLEKGLPKVFREISEGQITQGLGELISEINHHGGGDSVRIQTQRGKASQKVIIAWNGLPLPEDLILRINTSYKKGLQESFPPQRHGTEIAGYWLGLVGGIISIENQDDREYFVRNVIEIPDPFYPL